MKRDNRNKEKRVIISDIKKMLKSDSPFRIKEAYNLVRAKLLFTTKGDKCPVYVVTSSRSDEGKSKSRSIRLIWLFLLQWPGKRH